MKHRILASVLLLLSLLVLVMFWPETAPPRESGSTKGTAAERSTAQAAPTPEQDTGTRGTAQAEAERSSIPSPGTVKPAVFRGRCVDVVGAPLAGIEVALSAWAGNAERMAKHRAEHGEVEWTDPDRQVTTADGRFEFRFHPPPPYQVVLDLKRVDLVRMTGRWGQVAPGSVKDFGDLVLAPGCQVRGRLEDTEGKPVAQVNVSIDRYRPPYYPPQTEIYSPRSSQVRTLADGSFSFRYPVPAGPWKLAVSGKTLVKPEALVVPEDQSDWFVTIVVRSEKDIPSIRGLVVNDRGEALRGVHLQTGGANVHSSSGESKRDGTFVLRNPSGSGTPARVTASLDGYEHGQTDAPVPWGSEGLRIVLRRGLDLEVRVTDADTGKPVLDYGVYAQPNPGRGQSFSFEGERLRSQGRHPGGVVTVPGLRRGPYLLLVEPTGGSWLHSGYHPVLVSDRGPNTVEIKVSKGVRRVLQVESATGKPIGGTKVELVEPVGDTVVGVDTWIVRLHSGSGSSASRRALSRQDGETDGDGRMTLVGPAKGGYVLRILGPGHRPQIETGVELAAGAAPLVVKVSAGATLIGQIGPAKLVEQVGGRSSSGAHYSPGLRLKPMVLGASPNFPANHSEGFVIDEAGRFEMTGVPPGSWKLVLSWDLNQDEVVRELADLKEGETRKLTLDLPDLIQAHLRGQVRHNGKPVTEGSLSLKSDSGRDRVGRWRNLVFDGKGQFDSSVLAGDYSVTLSVRHGKTWSMISAPDRLSIQPGQELRRNVDIRSRVVRLRVLGSDQKPRAGVCLQVGIPNQGWHKWLAGTDTTGLAAFRAPVEGELKIFAWPAAWNDPRDRAKLAARHADDPGAAERKAIQVGVVPAGEADLEIRIELPASAGY